MCYAIPGKVVEISNKIVTIEYFNEKKKARNDFFELLPNDYVFAQGGFVIQKVPEKEAISIIQTWKDLFFRLQEKDQILTLKKDNIYELANSIRKEHLGNSCCVHGIIEFSNYCIRNCLYCGLRKDNNKIKRYRMSLEQIIKLSEYASNVLGFKAIVLQSGEDLWYTDEKLLKLVEEIHKKCSIFLILSIGERDINLFKKLYKAGARGILLRFETGNENLYSNLKEGQELKKRINLLRELREIGYLIFTGFLIGLPNQTFEDIISDIHLTNKLGAEMFSFGPFIPHPETPLKYIPRPSLKLILTVIAKARVLYPESKILVTTALETLDKKNGAYLGLKSGANSLMINITPQKYRKMYEIYPQRADVELSAKNKINKVINLLQSLGRAPIDLGLNLKQKA
jgi:biotin synthase